MNEHEPHVVDDSEVLQEALHDEESGEMNVKNGGGWGPSIVVGLVVGAGSNIMGHWLDASSNKDTILNNQVSTLVEVKTEVAGLTEQVKQLREQPYVRREEFESRFTGLSDRLNNVERNEQSRRR